MEHIFKNTIPTKIDEIRINEFREIFVDNKLLIKLLLKYSRNSLSSISKKEIEKEMTFLREELNLVIQGIEKKEFKNYEEFYDEILLIITTIKKNKFKSIYLIMIDYFSMLIPYLSYHFNDIKLKNEKKKIKQIKVIFLEQIKNILNDYILCLERIIK